jgi:hypothetical protein
MRTLSTTPYFCERAYNIGQAMRTVSAPSIKDAKTTQHIKTECVHKHKDWRCHARITPARSPWWAHVACVSRLRQRQSFSRMLLSQKQNIAISAPLIMNSNITVISMQQTDTPKLCNTGMFYMVYQTMHKQSRHVIDISNAQTPVIQVSGKLHIQKLVPMMNILVTTSATTINGLALPHAWNAGNVSPPGRSRLSDSLAAAPVI